MKSVENRKDRSLLHEPLEDRHLLSVSPTLVELNPSGGSSPTDFTEIGGLTYFVANDGTTGRELWVTDGTEAGTTLLKDIHSGSGSSTPSELTEFDGQLYFIADDGVNGQQLWKSDGTAAGTVLVDDPGSGDPIHEAPGNLAVSGGNLFFSASTETDGAELWMIDGTTGNVGLVKDIYTGSTTVSNVTTANSSSPLDLVDVNGTLYFTARDGANGRELWKSDGTAAGTVLVEDINSGTDSSDMDRLVAVGDQLFFFADNGSHGYELWVSDGTAAGTQLVKDIASGVNGAVTDDSPMIAVGNRVFFAADDRVHGDELWVSDGTAAGTYLVKDITDGSEGDVSVYPNFVEFQGELYFSADDGVNGKELWKSDGTASGTVMIADISVGSESSFPFHGQVVDNALYFSAASGVSGRELWRTDGTTAGTRLVVDMAAGDEGSYPVEIGVANDVLLFDAYIDSERELVLLDTATALSDSASLTIYVDGQAVVVPANIGVESDGSTTDIFTVDATGRLKMDPSSTLTLGDFFELWRTGAGLVDANADATFSSTELMGADADLQNSVLMFVNGQIVTEFDDYVVQDGDEIVLAYTSHPVVSINTNYGAIIIELFDGDTPGTVENFLNYVNDGDYIDSFFHRSVANFVIQGGGFATDSEYFTSTGQFSSVPTDDPITNEPGISNLRGTIAMAKLGGDPDSATSQFFVNLGDNSSLDLAANNAFTVFGQVLDMTTVDEIAALPINTSNSSPYGELPLGTDNTLVVVESVVGYGEVTGVQFQDDDLDGQYDAGEQAVAGVTVFVDANDNGVLDAGELSTVTDSNGQYRLAVPSGTSTVRSLYSAGATATTADALVVALQVGAQEADVNFGESPFSAPSGIALDAASDTGVADDDGLTMFDNSSDAKKLSFTLTGLTTNATANIYAVLGAGSPVLIGSAVVTADTMTIATDGATTLVDGNYSFYATQTIGASESDASTPIGVTIDATAPVEIASLPSGTLNVGDNFSFDLDHAEETGGTISYSLENAPTGMTVDAATGALSWTPTSDQAKPHDVTIVVTDEAGNATSRVVAFDVLSTTLPANPDDGYTVDEDTTLTISDAASGVLENDDATLTVAELVSQPANGFVTLNADGTFTYTPNGDFFGEDYFVYKAKDSSDNYSNEARVTITVNPLNDAPVAAVDSYSVDEDTDLNVDAASGVLANDEDVDGDSLTATLVDQATNGYVTLAADGSFTYTPDANFSGQDTFTYNVTDGVVSSTPITVTITVNGVNDAPVADDDAYTVSEDATLTVDIASGVLDNDTDVDGDSLEAVVDTQPSHGTLTLNTNGSFTYVPDANFYGQDTFTYHATDGNAQSSAVTVTITVTNEPDAPTAVDDSFDALNDGQSVLFDVLDNDSSDPDPTQTLTITAVGQGSQGGTIAIDSGQIRYTAPVGFTGTETFTYTIEDTDGLTSQATVTVTVAGAHDNALSGHAFLDLNGNGVMDEGDYAVPGAQMTLTGVEEGGASVSITVLTDADGYYLFDELAPGEYAITQRQPTALADGQASTTVPGAQVGVNQITGIEIGGGESYTDNNFTEAYLRSEYISIRMFMASSGSHEECLLDAIVQAEINAGDAELAQAIRDGVTTFPVAVADAYSLNEDTTLSIEDAAGVLANDSDPEDDALSAALAVGPSHGTLDLDPDGALTYTPDVDFHGTDTFTYVATDGDSNSEETTVTITVNPVNDAPVAEDDEYEFDENDTSLVVDAALGLLANDSDIDDAIDDLAVDVATQPSHGTLTLNDDGSFTYTPNNTFDGSDSFTYTVSDDDDEESEEATVTILAIDAAQA